MNISYEDSLPRAGVSLEQDIRLIHGALNEMCYGIPIFDFEQQLGASKATTRRLLRKMTNLFHTVDDRGARPLAYVWGTKFVVEPAGYAFSLSLEEMRLAHASIVETLCRLGDDEFDLRVCCSGDEARTLAEGLAYLILLEEARPGRGQDDRPVSPVAAAQKLRAAREEEFRERHSPRYLRYLLPRQEAEEFEFVHEMACRQLYRECAAMGWNHSVSMRKLQAAVGYGKAFFEGRPLLDRQTLHDSMLIRVPLPSASLLWGLGMALKAGDLLLCEGKYWQKIASGLPDARRALHHGERRQIGAYPTVPVGWSKRVAEFLEHMIDRAPRRPRQARRTSRCSSPYFNHMIIQAGFRGT